MGEEGLDGEAKEHKLYLTGMTCTACEKLISTVATQNGAKVNDVDAKYGTLTLVADDSSLENVKKKLADRGFRERKADEPSEGGRGDFTRVADYIRSLLAGEPHVEVEAKLANYAVASAAILMGLGILGYGSLLKGFGSAATIVSLLLLVIATSIMSVFSYYHMSSYRKTMSCMNGMMVGMTAGMMTGFMVGAIIGATNGIFIGSVVGVAIGIGLGFALGRFCGVMGAMEGIMAGLMSGTMGAMTSIMMLNDNLVAFLFILMAICGISMAALSYMMNRESGPAPNPEYSAGFARFFLSSALMSVFLLAVMLYGPKGAITFIR